VVPLAFRAMKRANFPEVYSTFLTFKQREAIDTHWDQTICGFDQSVEHLPAQDGFIAVDFVDDQNHSIASFSSLYRYLVRVDDHNPEKKIAMFDVSFDTAKLVQLSNNEDVGVRSRMTVNLRFEVHMEDEKLFLTNTTFEFPLHLLELHNNNLIVVPPQISNHIQLQQGSWFHISNNFQQRSDIEESN
jgi:hypothetical protein